MRSCGWQSNSSRSEQLAVQHVDILDQPRNPVARYHRVATRLAEAGTEAVVTCERRKAFCEPADVAHVHQESVDALAYDVRNPADARRDHRKPRGERLDGDDRRSFVRGRKQERIEQPEEGRDVTLVAEKEGATRNLELLGTGFKSRALGTIADEAQLGVDPQIEQTPKRQKHVRNPLDAGHSPDPPDDEA